MTYFQNVDKTIELDEAKSQDIEGKLSNDLLANTMTNTNGKFDETESRRSWR
jgi:hypothetical protein